MNKLSNKINSFRIEVKLLNKQKLTETDIRTKYITPAKKNAGWDIQNQIREEYAFTDGRIFVRKNISSRGKKKIVDYLLFLQDCDTLIVFLF